MAAIILMAAIGGWCIATGQISYVITHGVSMNPVYHQNDLVFVVKADRYQVGEIVAYRSPSTGVEVLHRIIAGNTTDGYQFKGDNNESVDPEIPTSKQLIGQAVLHVPKGGVWLKPVLSPTGLGMMGFLIVGGAATTARTRREIPRGRRKKKVKAMARQGGSWEVAAAIAKVVLRLHPLLRAAAAMVAVLALFAVTLGVLGWMKPTVVMQETSSEQQTMIFAYSAKVPKSPAYDGTVVTSPDPIFRKLADRIDVQMHYAGPPGSFDASATLSNDSGWHSELLLLTPRRFTGKTFDTAVNLSLNAFDDRAKAAADAIGITPGPLIITVKTRVTTAGGQPFTASLPLTLAPVQLSLGSGASSLVVTSGSSADAVTVVRAIEVFGYPVMTAARARGLAIMLLLGAIVGAVALFLVARRENPLRTRDDIERRYPALLVPVEPMASPPGKPVVSVDNFPALVKLAERYGQMILTWSRPDADDFVVRDEGITYRYRIEFEDAPSLQNVERIDRPSTGSHRRKASNQAT